jgi:3-deoxy-manno-octulosonate cytidylyltransferase (CMP-KDO synthetase)
MRFLGVIPARYGSTRLPAKPLLKIAGKPLLQWVIEGIRSTPGLDEIVVATDHAEIADLAASCGVRGILTDPELQSGTDRVFQASLQTDADVIFNIQGDEPLVRPEWLTAMMAVFREQPNVQMATVATKAVGEDMGNMAAVKVITDRNGDAIYFSRHAIPYTRVSAGEHPDQCLKHIGLYGFRREFLRAFCDFRPTALEKCESLEQLRALYMGHKIRVLPVQGESIGIDTPEDVKRVEAILLK